MGVGAGQDSKGGSGCAWNRTRGGSGEGEARNLFGTCGHLDVVGEPCLRRGGVSDVVCVTREISLNTEGSARTRPSKMPSPVVAQLGSTFHTWSFAIFSSWSLSETSLGRMAVVDVSSDCLQVGLWIRRARTSC
jgi:hypothetical protein